MPKKQKEIIEMNVGEEPEMTEYSDIEEPKKQPKEEIIEIKTENLFIRIPKREELIQKTINILNTFITKIPKTETAMNYLSEYPQKPTITKIEREYNEEEPFKQQEIIAVNPKDKFEICPVCNGKIIREKVQQLDDAITQVVRCKDKHCGFTRKYIVNL